MQKCDNFIMKKISNLIHKKAPQIVLLCIFDALTVTVTGFFSLWLRSDFGNIDHGILMNFLESLPVDIVITIIIFNFFSLYTSIWRFASITELTNTISAVCISELIIFGEHLALDNKLPNSYPFIHVIFMFILICGSRYSYRILRTIKIHFEKHKKDYKRTMLIGGGECARLIIDETIRNDKFKNEIICIIDDDKKRQNAKLRNIPIVGDRKYIQEASKRYRIEEIIIAIPSASKETISKIVEECKKIDAELKILPSNFLNLSKENQANVSSQIRPISYEDFLGRDQIVVDTKEIADTLTDKTVLVTGGGGSIGSELCRQIAKCNPKELIIFDIYENNAYDIEQELYRKYPDINLKTIIGSIRDYKRLEKVFEEYSPEIVFHAAAHKHVPLMEFSPNEAVKNNCLGTLNTVKLANKYKTKKFVLISSDKAVRPTNVMGATKRICEMIIQTYDKKSKTDFVAVRFGNVLGSNGSVIPLFMKQIDNGGPVTVTDKNITRFFMTIPEAVSLVLQASVYASGGEIFVLDMGEPVKIYDLAKKIIRYRGFEPEKDIKIKITGLRPGEKLYEEILMNEEGMKSTPNKLIHIGQPLKIDNDFEENLDILIEKAQNNNNDIKSEVAKIVKTYTRKEK